MPTGEIYQLFKHFPPGRGTGGHVGVVVPHELDAGEVHGFQGLEIRIPAIGFHQVISNHLGLAHAGGRAVGRIAGVGHQHLVSGIEEGEGQEQNTLLGTHQGLDFGGRVQLNTIPLGIPVRNGLTQFGNAHITLIAVGILLLGALAKGLDGFGRRSSVRGADSQVDDRVQALGGTLCVDLGYLLVLDGEVILLDRKGSVGGLDNHD